MLAGSVSNVRPAASRRRARAELVEHVGDVERRDVQREALAATLEPADLARRLRGVEAVEGRAQVARALDAAPQGGRHVGRGELVAVDLVLEVHGPGHRVDLEGDLPLVGRQQLRRPRLERAEPLGAGFPGFPRGHELGAVVGLDRGVGVDDDPSVAAGDLDVVEADGDQVLWDVAAGLKDGEYPVYYYSHESSPPTVRQIAPGFREWLAG